VNELLHRIRQSLTAADNGSVDGLNITGPEHVLASVFDVTGLASATIAAATCAAAEVLAARSGNSARTVFVDRRSACAAFLSEALFAPDGWERAAIWDPIAGDYLAADGWIKLHTNYRYHRAAAEKVLGAGGDRKTVAEAVSRWSAGELETAIVDAGGCAAAMRDRQQWLASAPGAATAEEPLVRLAIRPAAPPAGLMNSASLLPFTGIRVLDLTRVIAGPVCTRFLAAYGADVLRIDPRDFDEVPSLLPETTAGKRCARLDLRTPEDRQIFEDLVRRAHILVGGVRPGALAGLGYDQARLIELNPGLITASLDAYGWSGPWASRRGFDSLVQMSTGIAAAGAAARHQERPGPLPAQALDHGTGYLLAAALGHALVRLLTQGQTSEIRCSLVATGNLLFDFATPGGLSVADPLWSTADTEECMTAWGPARRVPIPGRIEGVATHLRVEAGPLGRHAPAWAA
jgi:hypothetical protein